MTKREFLLRLGMGLASLPQREAAERIAFYREAIEDRIEEGLSEEEAVRNMGDVGEIVAQILAERTAEEESPTEEKRMTGGVIALLAIGSPLWVPLAVVMLVLLWIPVTVLAAVELPFFLLSMISKCLFPTTVFTGKWTLRMTKRCFTRSGWKK